MNAGAMIHGARLSINSSNRWPASNCIYQQFTLRKANEHLSLQCPRVLGIDEHTLHKAKRWEFPTEVIFLRRIMLHLTEVLFDIFQLTVGKTGNT